MRTAGVARLLEKAKAAFGEKAACKRAEGFGAVG